LNVESDAPQGFENEEIRNIFTALGVTMELPKIVKP
jgi:hypothetical protein